MHNRSKTLFWIVVCATLVSVSVTYWRMFIAQSYEIVDDVGDFGEMVDE